MVGVKSNASREESAAAGFVDEGASPRVKDVDSQPACENPRTTTTIKKPQQQQALLDTQEASVVPSWRECRACPWEWMHKVWEAFSATLGSHAAWKRGGVARLCRAEIIHTCCLGSGTNTGCVSLGGVDERCECWRAGAGDGTLMRVKRTRSPQETTRPPRMKRIGIHRRASDAIEYSAR